MSTTLKNLNSKAISEIQRLLKNGGRVSAMKVYMRETCSGLKDSKDAVDEELEFLKRGDPELQEVVRKADDKLKARIAGELLSNPLVRDLLNPKSKS